MLALAGSAQGQQAERDQQALARAQALLRQVSSQKQELEATNARLTAELDALQRKLGKAEASLKKTNVDLQVEQRKAERAGGALEDNRERLTRTEEGLRETRQRLQKATADLRQKEADAAALQARLAEVEGNLADSERKNLELYQANVELLELYREKGPWAALLQREPVTGIKGVAIENTLQEYRAKLEQSLTDSNRKALRSAPDPAPASD
jgi:chromosome segregation ATPase